MDPAAQQAQAMHMIMTLMPMFFLFGIVVIAAVIFPVWKICQKAGLSGPLSLLILLWPIGLLIVLYIIAFSDWKVMPVAAYPPPVFPPVPPTPYPPNPQGYVPPPQQPPTGV